jgi:hypothetical protein
MTSSPASTCSNYRQRRIFRMVLIATGADQQITTIAPLPQIPARPRRESGKPADLPVDHI